MDLIRKIKNKDYDLSYVVIILYYVFIHCFLEWLCKHKHNEFILYGKDAINDLFSYTRGILLFIITSIALLI